MFLFIESYVYVQLTFVPTIFCLSGPHIMNCVHHFSSLVIVIPIRDVLIILNLCSYSIRFICHLASFYESGEPLFLVPLCVCACELRYYPLYSSLSFSC